MCNRLADMIKERTAVLELLLMLYTLVALLRTDSYYVIYLIMGLIAFVNFSYKINQHIKIGFTKPEKRYLLTMTICIAACITLANYKVFTSHHTNTFKGLVIFAGCYWLVKNDLNFLYERLNNCSWKLTEKKDWSPRKIFLLSFLGIAGVNFIYLLGSAFPGILTPDSISQVQQIITGIYSNHHPFWHTQIIRFWINIGLAVFHGDLTYAVALYSSFLICFMAACFSYMLMTCREAGIPIKEIAVFFFFIVLMPYNISYSVTMWKNIMFSGAILFFATDLFRILHGIGNKVINFILLAISGLCICLWQSNGIPAFTFTMVLMAIINREKKNYFISIGLVITCIAIILIGPVLRSLGVRQTEVNETLSIPQQQMSRVLHDKKHVEPADLATLSNYADVNLMGKKYIPFISDNTKKLIHGDYFLSHKKEYLKVWLKLGMQYPWEYGKAWIDETRGYWNGGYKYWIWGTGINKKAKIKANLTLDSQVNVKFIDKIFSKYFSLYTKNMMVVFLSIGLHVWIMCLLCGYCLLKKKKDFILAVPSLTVIATLLISTPVFCEFRYAYSIFTTFPLMVMASFYKGPGNVN